MQDSIGRSLTKSFILKVSSPLSITSASLPVGYLGSTYSGIIQTGGGIAPYSFSSLGVLPDGLSLEASTGTVSGMPTVAGLGNFSISVTDSSYPTPMTFTKAVSLRVWNALVITTTSPLLSGSQRVVYSTTLAGSGGAQPRSWSLASGTLPTGVNLNASTGTISGTPTNCGTFSVVAQLTDSALTPKTAQKEFSLTVSCLNDYIITGNAGISGTIISYSGPASGSVTADNSGNFSIGPLAYGTYTITPSKTLYVFTPALTTIAIADSLTLPAFSAVLDTEAPTIMV